MSQWTPRSPGAGDTDTLTHNAASLYDLVSAIVQLRDIVNEQITLISPATWNGEASRAFLGRAETLAAALVDFAQQLATYESALTTYAADVATIASEANGLGQQHAVWDSQRSAARRQRLTAQSTARTSPSAARALAEALSRERTATLQLARIDSALHDLAARRGSADAALRTVIDQVPSNGFVRMGGILVAAGLLPRANLLDGGALAEVATGLARLVAEGDASDQVVADLAEVLRMIARTPDAASKLVLSLGGDGLATVLLALDRLASDLPEPVPGASDAVQLVRDALSSASSLWDPTTADRFARDLLGDSGNALVVAYLFHDPDGAPMSASLTFATAQAITDWEQVHGRALGLFAAPLVASPMLDSLDGGYDAALLQGYCDAAAEVAGHMALYPDQAITWFADATDGQDRIHHWFGRDWRDGYTAITGLAAAMNGTTSIRPGEDYSAGIAEALAGINALAIPHLVGTMRGGTSTPSDIARLSLERIIEAQLPGWLEKSLIGAPSSGEPNKPGIAELPWLGTEVFSNTLKFGDITWIFGEICRSDLAASRLAAYIDRLCAEIFAGVEPGGFSSTDAANRVAGILGAIDAGRFATEFDDAQARDAGTQATIEVTTLPLGLIGDNPATALLAGAATNQAVSQLTPWLANDYATAVGDFLNGTGAVTERERAARAAVGELIAEHDPGLAGSITEDQFNQIAYFYRRNLQTCTQIDLDDLEGY